MYSETQMKSIMKVYITKYALTKGIIKKNVEQDDKRTVRYDAESHFFWAPTTQFYKKPDWHIDKDKAVKRAERMRIMKINALKKEIIRLENLNFNK